MAGLMEPRTLKAKATLCNSLSLFFHPLTSYGKRKSVPACLRGAHSQADLYMPWFSLSSSWGLGSDFIFKVLKLGPKKKVLLSFHLHRYDITDSLQLLKNKKVVFQDIKIKFEELWDFGNSHVWFSKYNLYWVLNHIFVKLCLKIYSSAYPNL